MEKKLFNRATRLIRAINSEGKRRQQIEYDRLLRLCIARKLDLDEVVRKTVYQLGNS